MTRQSNTAMSSYHNKIQVQGPNWEILPNAKTSIDQNANYCQI